MSSERRSASTTRRLGPVLWTREHRFVWHRVVHQTERYYLVRAEADELTPELGVETEEGMHEYRWWTPDELASSEVARWPTRLAELLEDLLEHGPPALADRRRRVAPRRLRTGLSGRVSRASGS